MILDDSVDGDQLDSDSKESHRNRFHGHTVRHTTFSTRLYDGYRDKGFFTEGCIRKMELTPSVPNGVRECFPDGMQNGVIYSLSKKKRWELVPSLIEGVDQYAENEFKKDEVESKVKVNIREWTKLYTRDAAQAVGFHSTDAPRHHVIDKTHCFSIDSLKRKPEEGEEVIPHEVRYDVVYPPEHDWHQRRVTVHSYQHKDPRRMGRQHLTYTKDDLKGYREDDFDDEYAEDDELPAESPRSKGFSVPIEDLILTDQAEANVPKTRSDFQSNDGRKDRKVFLTRSRSINAATSQPSHLPQQGPESIPRQVLVTPETVDPSHLKQVFGIAYVEGDCVPRRFLIDMSSVLREEAIRAHKIPRDAVQKVSFESCLLFELVESGSDSFSAVKVSAKIDCDADSLCVESLLEDSLYSVEAVVDMSVQFVSECFFERLKRSSRVFRPTVGMFSIVELVNAACGSAQHVTSVPNEEKVAMLHAKEESDCTVEDEYEIIVNVDGACCGICFAEINGECTNGTALKMCGHWFCDECWRGHVTTALVRGGTLVECPAYDCKACANLATVAAFADCHQLSLYRQRREMILFTDKYDKDVKYCPTPNCGAMLRASGVSKFGRAFTQCDQCQLQLCFECMHVPHWPATCQQAAEYHNRLKELGDDPFKFVFEPFVVTGRNCPKCARFITKGEGCNHMTCTCKYQFCWLCGGDWITHGFTGCPSKDQHSLQEREIRHMFRPNEAISDHYTTAIHHRLIRARGPWLALLRDNNSGSRYTGTDKSRLTSIRDWGIEMNLVHFCYLLHFVVEYTFVISTTSKKKDRASGARDNLKFIADRLMDILQHQRDTLMKKEPERVRHLITYGQTCLERLVAGTN